MADLISLDQTATTNDRVMPQWLNAVKAKLETLEQQLALANETIQKLRAETAQAFRVTVASGLSLSYAGGVVKLLNGDTATISTGAISAPDNTVSYLYVDAAGEIAIAQTRPDIGLELARITTAGGKVTELINYPQFRVQQAPVSLEDYATVEYANSIAWSQVARGRKTSIFNIATTDTYYTIPFEELQGNGLNTGGIFTPPVDGTYLFNPRIRVDSLSPSSPLAVKLSLYINDVEVLLHQGDSAYGDLSATMLSESFNLTTSDRVSMRVYLTRGTLARVREGSIFVCWRIP
ncbi:MAG: hypothetical protein SWZ49_13680 [Cyanobacteriota bacterium]|nr:hypothetical protein [Cyanobacteriota bacterium]